MYFYVHDGTGFGSGEGGGAGGGNLCCGMPSFPRDLPPAAIYQLVLTPDRGDVLVAPGKHPVYYRRTLGACRGGSFREVDRQQYRLDYLAELSRLSPDTIKQALAPSTIIQWTAPDAYSSQVEAAVSAQQAAILQLLESLHSGGGLEHEEADALQLRILIDQVDQRKNGEALPNLMPVPVNYSDPKNP